MNRTTLFGYQLVTGIADTLTGGLLMVAPELTLRLMHLQAPSDALIYVSFIGAFVFSVGLACLYGARLADCGGCRTRLEVVWLLTAFTRASVATFVAGQIMAGTLQTGWLTVAAMDGACVVIQAIGLRRGWLALATR
ncbi:MAG TPA: hypothetical protein VMV39_07485 [Terracidiphilus sp.]|jgi:hypothetical protein|nr:hypothetical protein [Terracidiphilus sp.]